ncbi:MAG TPA: ATP-binding protein [Solirubrobacteraceae bacterium]|jgi:serine/threonine-protein kinase RsbW/stage II sporulation protein AB (anti-sigma F factor)|nr:ATP-binding protein [Solirubrobacteraceae bacterium]
MALMQPGAALDAVYPAQPTRLAEIRRDVEDAATGCGADATALLQIGLAVSEAVTNAILHGYRDRATGGDVRVAMRREDEFLDISVCDDGTGIIPGAGSPGLGLGLSLMAHEAHSFGIRTAPGEGTEIHLRFRLCRTAGTALRA